MSTFNPDYKLRTKHTLQKSYFCSWLSRPDHRIKMQLIKPVTLRTGVSNKLFYKPNLTPSKHINRKHNAYDKFYSLCTTNQQHMDGHYPSQNLQCSSSLYHQVWFFSLFHVFQVLQSWLSACAHPCYCEMITTTQYTATAGVQQQSIMLKIEKRFSVWKNNVVFVRREQMEWIRSCILHNQHWTFINGLVRSIQLQENI